MVGTGGPKHGAKGTYNPAATTACKLRFALFREACIRYIQENGPSLDRNLLDFCTKSSDGRVFQNKPRHSNSLNNLLQKDKRFYVAGHLGSNMSIGGRIWGLVGDEQN